MGFWSLRAVPDHQAGQCDQHQHHACNQHVQSWLSSASLPAVLSV
ncbi:MAG: DUF3587 domain-containing protein [Oxalobacteraceae bacterium]|nr:MAG: DUF3587 domain-containing protein [Oxalobacteraceae bacterium]